MAHFTLQIGQDGPMLSAVVGVSQARADALTKAGQSIPKPVPIRALVDTGASCTCIDTAILKGLGLSPTGTVSVVSPTTGAIPHPADQYDVGLLIPPAAPHHAPYILSTLPVTATDLSIQGLQALIGRDILRDCLLTYNGTIGLFTLAF